MALFKRTFECPSCGATLEQENQASKTLACSYCGQTSHLFADSIKAAGEKHLLIDYGSFLKVRQDATLLNERIHILGKLRIGYDDGFWDEWYVQFEDGTFGWVGEDDGAFTLYHEIPLNRSLKNDFAYLSVGKTLEAVSDYAPNVFMTTKGSGKVIGGEGELPFAIIPNEKVDFIEGIFQGQVFSAELYAHEEIGFLGQPFEIDQLVFS